MRSIALPIVLLFNLAIAQPLLDLLGRHAEFFVAHDASGRDVIFLGVGLALVLPGLFGIATWLTIRAHRTAGAVASAAIEGVLLAALALQIVKRAPVLGSLPGAVVAAVAIVGGAAAMYLLRRPPVQRALVFAGAPVAVAVVALFLLVSPASKLALGGGSAAATVRTAIRTPAPVVMVLLDEFPVTTLLDRHDAIDARLFPNFARLAGDGTWYRNATSVHVSTPTATPAIVDGLVPRAGKLPIVQDHPNNLFTLLGPQYRVTALEPVTQLCPASICQRACPSSACGIALEEPRAVSARWGPMMDDMGIVFLHELLPESLTGWLPRIDDAWEGFARNDEESVSPEPTVSPQGGEKKSFRESAKEQLSQDRADIFRRWIASISRPDRPSLSYIHAMLPHTPWVYTPAGGTFRATEFLRGAGRVLPADPWKSALYYQRHIVQAQFVDRLIGELITRLEQQGMYDDALVVIVSDHGASFRASQYRRVAVPENIGDIAPVPLFIKRPHQPRGGTSDLPVMTIDVLPSILDVLGFSDPPPLDGVSVFSEPFPSRPVRLIQTEGRPPLRLMPDGRERAESLRRKFSLFGQTGESLEPYALGPDADLLGRPADGLSTNGAPAVEIREPGLYRSVSNGFAVSPVTGYLHGRSDGSFSIAVSVNGTIRAVTRTLASSGAARPFVALIPVEAFRSGRNDLRFFFIEEGPAGRRMLAIVCRNCP